jgi:hypothetical protein
MTESQSLFGIGYCFLFGIASAGAPRQVWKPGRPAPGLRIVLQQHSQLHGRIILLANLADSHDAAHWEAGVGPTECHVSTGCGSRQ